METKNNNMTKETILKRLLIEDKITIEELIILAKKEYKDPIIFGPKEKQNFDKEWIDKWIAEQKKHLVFQKQKNSFDLSDLYNQPTVTFTLNANNLDGKNITVSKLENEMFDNWEKDRESLNSIL